MELLSLPVLAGIVTLFSGALFTTVIIAIRFRRVVATNEVHIVQEKKTTSVYGKGYEKNVYYEWPSQLPFIGITKIDMPTSIFSIKLDDYSAYDKDRLPFAVDIIAFFQVEKAETAAQRVSSFRELESQLTSILQDAIRTILAKEELNVILEERAQFGESFTREVAQQLPAWGVKSVKNIGLMDIRDAEGSEVIKNIMKMKQSEVEKFSTIAVANNNKEGTTAEIEASRDVEVTRQQAEKQQGEAEAEKYKAVGIANEVASQEVKEAERVTAEKDMAVKKVEQERQADIDKNVAVIEAGQDKKVKQKAAEAYLIQETKKAEAVLISQTKAAEGIEAVGKAEATANELMEMSSVTPQIKLAQEIGKNKEYQQYLLGIDGLKAGQIVGVAKAEAMGNGDLKVIANSGSVEGGLTKMMDVFSSKGGTELGSMLEAMKQTPTGKVLLEKLIGKEKEDVDA